MFDNLFSDDPKQQALLMMAMGLLGSNNSKGGRGFASDLGQAGLLGMQGYSQAKQQQSRMESDKLARQMHQLQLGDLLKGQQFNEALRSGMAPGAPPAPYNDTLGNQPPQGPTLGSAPKMDFSQAYAIDPLKAHAAEAAMAKPMKELKDTRTLMKDGQRVTVNIFKDGTTEIVPFQPDAEKAHFATTGAQTAIPLDPFTGKPLGAGLQASMDPAQADASKRGWAGLVQGDQHFKAGLGQSERHFQQSYGKPQLVEGDQGYSSVVLGAPGGPQVTPIPALGKGTKNQPSEAELTAAGYASRMEASNALLSGLPSTATPGFAQTVANNKFQTTAPFMSSSGQQQYRQAQEDWVRAKLRKESGAVIADEEMAREIRVYFPQPGDKEKVIEQKAEARKRANDAMMMAAGKARNLIQPVKPQGFRYLGPE